jgi:hypothetical protein
VRLRLHLLILELCPLGADLMDSNIFVVTANQMGEISPTNTKLIHRHNSIIGATGGVSEIANSFDGNAVKGVGSSTSDGKTTLADSVVDIVLADFECANEWLPLETLALGMRVGLYLKVDRVPNTRGEILAELGLYFDKADAVALGIGITPVSRSPETTSTSLLGLTPDLTAPSDGEIVADDDLEHEGAKLAAELGVKADDCAVELATQPTFHGSHEDVSGGSVGRL